MATNNSEAKPKKAHRIHRFAIGVNVLAQIAVILRRDLLAHPPHVGDSGFF